MKATKNTAPSAPALEIVEETAKVSATPTQFIVNVEERDKTFLAELQEELGLKNTKELISLLLKVSTDHRFTPDGVDTFETEANAITKGRAKAKAMSQLEKTKAKLAELMAMMES